MVQQLITRFAFLLLLSLNGGHFLLGSQSFIVATNNVFISYPSKIVFSLSVESEHDLTRIVLHYGTSGKNCLSSSMEQMIEFTSGKSVEINWSWGYFEKNYLPPGTTIWWYWEIEDNNGEINKTPNKEITLHDNRYDWHTLENQKLALSWIEGDYNFGSGLFQIANDALSRMRNQAGLELDQQIQVFIYPEPVYFVKDLQSVPDWTGGVAFSDFSIILISISQEGEDEWASEVIPHEVAHVITGSKIYNCKAATIPLWMNEGLSVFNEGPIKKTDFDKVQSALKNNQLPTLISLKSNFSVNSSRADLEYSFSGQAVEYLIEQYGYEKLQDLLSDIANGINFEDAMRKVYGLSTIELDYQFRTYRGFEPSNWSLDNKPLSPQTSKTAIPTMELFDPSQIKTTATLPTENPVINTYTPSPIIQSTVDILSKNEEITELSEIKTKKGLAFPYKIGFIFFVILIFFLIYKSYQHIKG